MTILCTIDLETREVSLPAGQVIASYDHNVDVIRFQVETIPGFSLNTSSIKIAAQGPNNVRHDYAVDPSTVSIEEETGYITFDWPIPQGVTEMPIGTFKYGDKGRLIFAVCAEIISGDTVSKAWHSDDGIITVVAHLEPESGGGEDPEEEATNAQKIAQLQTDVAVINTQVGALGNGSPTPVETVAEMTDESAVYLYTGSETGYTAGNWYYWNGTAWTSGGTYGGAVTSTTFNQHGVPADDFAVGEALADKADADDVTALTTVVAGKADDTDVTALDTRVIALEEGGGGITAAVKNALLALFRNVAYIGTDGQDLYDDLYDAFYDATAIRLDNYSLAFTTIGGTAQITATTVPAGGTITWESSDISVATVDQTGLVTSVGYGSAVITAISGSASASCSITVSQATLSGISVVYTQSGTVYPTTALDTLKPDIVVTASWSDGTTSTVSSSMYVLSGTLSVGSSIVTVSYGGKTTTFRVTVSAVPTVSSISAVYTQSGTVKETDTLDSLKADLVVRAYYTDSSIVVVPANDYTLSGTLTVGTSTITVSYDGKTATFNVNVTASGGAIDRIDADFNKGTNKIYESTSLDTLKQYLTITIYYSDGTTGTAAPTDYSLTGALVGGTNSVVTVTYNRGGATGSTSFTVDVESIMYDWDLTQSLYDKIANNYATPSAGENYGAPSRTSNGVKFIVSTQMLTLIDGDDDINHLDMTVEIDVASFSFKGDNTKHVRFFMDQCGDDFNSVGTGPLIFRANYGWTSYGYSDANHTEKGYRKWSDTGWGSLYNTDQINALNGKTVKIYYGADGHTRKLYLDGTLVGTMTDVYFYKPTLRLRLGGGTSYSASSGDQCYDMTISGVRIYRGEV